MEEAIREGVRVVPRLARNLQSEGIYKEDLEEIRRFAKSLPNSGFAGNPELLAQEYRRLLSLLEQLELQVRRTVEEEQGDRCARRLPNLSRKSTAKLSRNTSAGLAADADSSTTNRIGRRPFRGRCENSPGGSNRSSVLGLSARRARHAVPLHFFC